MKYVFLLLLGYMYPTQLFCQNSYWKREICKQEEYTGSDSVTFCNLFDSLNKRYNVSHIMQIKKGKNRFIPIAGSMNLMIIKKSSYMYISWVEELSHAVQFSNRKSYYKAKACIDMICVFWKHFWNKHRKSSNLKEIYSTLYENKRSFEYEAHDIIEPVLWQSINRYMKK